MSYRKSCKIEPKHAGLVIGKQGSNIKVMQRMNGICSVSLDTRSSSLEYTLQVQGISNEACEAVICKVKNQITCSVNNYVPRVARIFVSTDHKDLGLIELRPYGVAANESVIFWERDSHKQRYLVSSFQSDDMSDRPIKTKRFKGSLEDDIEEAFQESLDANDQRASNETVAFGVSPGKMVFLGNSNEPLERKKLSGANYNDYLKTLGFNAFFNPYLNPRYMHPIKIYLQQLGFENLNEGPECYTTVHLHVVDGTESTNLSVVLAVDKDLEALNPSEDPRFSEDKKTAISKIMNATTIGQVLEISHSLQKLKVQYFKLSKYVHPDKNLHPGATQAFKKLGDAYERAKKGCSLQARALEIQCKSAVSECLKPPKVVKVKSKKIKACAISILSEKTLDMRATLVRYRIVKEELEKSVRDALNTSWEHRDISGRIPSLSSNQSITITSIKQVLEKHNWVKEIPFVTASSETAILKVSVKKMREKSGTDTKWNDCLEVDFKLSTGNDNDHLDEYVLAKKTMEIKRWIECLLK